MRQHGLPRERIDLPQLDRVVLRRPGDHVLAVDVGHVLDGLDATVGVGAFDHPFDAVRDLCVGARLAAWRRSRQVARRVEVQHPDADEQFLRRVLGENRRLRTEDGEPEKQRGEDASAHGDLPNEGNVEAAPIEVPVAVRNGRKSHVAHRAGPTA
jgi:hypothetical protein